MNSIKAKLMFAIALMMVLSLLTVAGFSYWKSSDLLTLQMEDTLRMQTQSGSKESGLWLAARQSEMELLANTRELITGNPENILPYIIQEDKRLNLYDGIFVADAEGNGFSSRGWKGSVKERKYFQDVLKTGNTVFSEVLSNKSTGKLSIIVSSPIKKDGKLVGIIGANIPFNIIQERITANKIGNTGHNFMLQKDGFVIVHPNTELVMKLNLFEDKAISSELKMIAQKMAKGETGIGQYDYNGTSMLAAYAPVPGTDWSIASSIEKKELAGRLTSLTLLFVMLTLGILVISLLLTYRMTRRIIQPVDSLRLMSERVADGDLRSSSMDFSSQDELGKLADSFAKMRGNMASLIQKIQKGSEHLAAASQELTASAEQSAQASKQVAIAIGDVAEGAEEQLAAAAAADDVVKQMSEGIKLVAANTNEVAIQSAEAADKAKSGGLALEKAVAQMGQIELTVNASAQVVAKLGERSNEIGQIVDAIAGIAGQTNLLALNAAIEAARAGEQGRGFAVVAEEVRKLAEQSQEAAKKIADLIGEIQGDTEQAVNAMNNGTREVKTGAQVVNEAGVAFRQIANLVTRVSEQVESISASIQQLAAGSERIVSSVQTIDQRSQRSVDDAQSVSAATEEQLASMDEIAASSRALAELAQELQGAVVRFQI